MTIEPVNLSDFLKRASHRAGVVREKYADNHAPDALAKIKVFLFFGDIRSEFILSTMLLHRLKQERCYLIVCSYPGHYGIYPYADEFWTIENEDAIESLEKGANGFLNTSKNFYTYERSLLRYFENVETFDQSSLSEYYDFGFTSKAAEEGVDFILPSIPSVHMEISRNLSKSENKKIFIKPTKQIRYWRGAKQEYSKVNEKFWITLVERIIKEGYLPVIWQDYSTYALWSRFDNNCAFVAEHDLLTVLGAMRACDCVLDVFSGISRYAYIARCPSLCCDDRQRYIAFKEYEIDDLCRVANKNIPTPIENVFSFSTIPEGNSWNNLFDHIFARLNSFLPILNKDELPTTMQFSSSLNFDNVRKIEKKRLGTRFIRIQR